MLKPKPEDVILQAQKKLAAEKTFRAETEFAVDGVLDRPEISFGESRVALAGRTRTDTDRTDPVDPASASTFDFTLTSGDERIVMRGEGRRGDYQHYVKLDEVSDALFPGIKEVEGEWMRSSDPFLDLLIEPLEKDLVLNDLTQEGYEEMHRAFGSVTLFEAKDTLPSETIDGVKTFHYAVALRPDVAAAMLARLRELRTGVEAAPEDYALTLAQVMSWGEPTGEVWIGRKDLRFRKIRLSSRASERTGGADVEATVWFSRYGQSVEAELPKDAKDVADLIGRVIAGRLNLAGDRLFSFRDLGVQPLPPSEEAPTPEEEEPEAEEGTEEVQEPEQGLPETEVEKDADTDGDGLADSQEFFYGSDAWNPDTDGDGWDDGTEVANGKDPTGPGALFGFGL